MTTVAPEREATITPDRPAPMLDGDHEKMSHYISKDQQESAWLTGSPAVALCGKVWLPTRDGQKFPLCPECDELFEMGPEGRAEHFRKRAENSGD